ncbi:MAG: hypothetical protein A2Y25_03435 [Candidatus Melainabacteria bacterium GWF2_37_15]|nr:MAG: hypothetical protein A2Y25_03435 [Candidatus Melainabacteria bacterium GWF2_37_15]
MIPRDLIPSDLQYVRQAIKGLVNHLEPLAKVSVEVSETVPRGGGRRTAAIIGKLYDAEKTVTPALTDTFNKQERYMIESREISPLCIQELRQNFYALTGCISRFGKKLSQIDWTKL